MKNFSIRLDKETEDILNDMSLSTGLPKSFLVRKFIKYIDEAGLLEEAIVNKPKKENKQKELNTTKEEKNEEHGFKLKL